MNILNSIIWGFAATIILTTLLSVSRWLHLTRMDIPFLLGTMWTPDRHKAKLSGFILHFIFGWLFAFIYVLAMESSGLKNWWFGMGIGAVHAAFILTVGMGTIATIHPRMATEDRGPDPTRLLEPPGFMMLNYGRGTPLATIVVHLIYGGIIGGFYHS